MDILRQAVGVILFLGGMGILWFIVPGIEMPLFGNDYDLYKGENGVNIKLPMTVLGVILVEEGDFAVKPVLQF